MIRALLLAAMLFATAVPALADEVDLALVLVTDVSRSIDDSEFALEKQGYAAAFTNPDQYSASIGATQALFRGLSDFAELRRRDVLIRAQQAEELR